MELIAKTAVICVVAALLVQLLERDTPELALLMSLSAVIVVLSFSLSRYREIRQLLDDLFARTGLIPELFSPVLKILAISLISRLAGDLCRDGGQRALASAIEISAALCALMAAAPLLQKALSLLIQLGGMG